MVCSSAVDLVGRAWLTLFVVAIGASVAHADQITYTFVSHAGAQDSERENKMKKRIVIVCSVLGLAAGSWAIQAQTSDDIQAQAGADNGGPVINSVPPGSLPANHGQVLCTGAINADGTIAGGQHILAAPSTTRLSTGVYQVGFTGPCNNVMAQSGFARWVQVDTLTTGTSPQVVCTTANRAGSPRAVWVQCTDLAGVYTNVSFFLFVAR
jgi:hypothetical protein